MHAINWNSVWVHVNTCPLLTNIRLHSISEKTRFVYRYVNAQQSILYLSMPNQWLAYIKCKVFFCRLVSVSQRICFVSLTWCLRHSVNMALELKHSVALSMVMTHWQSKTQPAWADSYGSPSHLTECLIAIATASCFIACCFDLGLPRASDHEYFKSPCMWQ